MDDLDVCAQVISGSLSGKMLTQIKSLPGIILKIRVIENVEFETGSPGWFRDVLRITSPLTRAKKLWFYSIQQNSIDGIRLPGYAIDTFHIPNFPAAQRLEDANIIKIWASEIFLDKRVNNMVYVKKTEYKGRIICGYFYKELSFYKNS